LQKAAELRAKWPSHDEDARPGRMPGGLEFQVGRRTLAFVAIRVQLKPFAILGRIDAARFFRCGLVEQLRAKVKMVGMLTLMLLTHVLLSC
jgi:hypothetical protein